MTATETKQPTTTSLWAEVVMFLVFFVAFAGGVILLWIGWIDESFGGPYSGTRRQKLTAWSIFATLSLLMAFPKYMELRSLKTGSSQAQKQFQSVRLAADSILILAVCLGCAYLIAVMLPASWGLEESPGLATGLVVTVAILAIMAVYVCLRALWNDAEPGARIAVAAFLVLAPVGYLLFSAIMSAIFVDIIVPAAVWLARPDLVPIIMNEGLSIGATMLAMSVAIVVIFLLRRRTLDGFDALSSAARTVLVVAGSISLGGMVLVVPVVMVVAFIRP